MYLQQTELLKVYRTFKSLDPTDPNSIVRYYEKHEKALNSLDFDQYFACLATYTDALFEAELYQKHLVMCDHLLELIIVENISSHRGEDIFQYTLLRKACTLNNLGETTQAREVIEQLIRINPGHRAARQVLAIMLLRQQPNWHQKCTGAAILCILAASVALAADTLLVHIFDLDFPLRLDYIGIGLLGLALSLIVGVKVFHTWRSYAYPRHMARKLLRKNQQ